MTMDFSVMTLETVWIPVMVVGTPEVMTPPDTGH